MKISVFYDHVLQASKQSGRPVKDTLRLCREAGIDAVEIDYACLKENAREICRDLEQASMKVSCIYHFHDFGRDPGVADTGELIRTASALGSGRVLVVPGELEERDAEELNSLHASYPDTAQYMDRHPRIRNMRRGLTELAADAEQKGVTVTLEDFDGSRQPFARTYQLLWFMTHVPSLGYTLDTGNFAYSNEDVLKAYEVLSGYIVHVHCKDRGLEPGKEAGAYNWGLKAVPVGSGYIPVAALIGKLKEKGYDGYLAIEHFGELDQTAGIRASAGFLHREID